MSRYMRRLPRLLARTLNLFDYYTKEESKHRIEHGGLRHLDVVHDHVYQCLLLGGFKAQIAWRGKIRDQYYGVDTCMPTNALYTAAYCGHIGLARWLLRSNCTLSFVRGLKPYDMIDGCIDSGHIGDLDIYLSLNQWCHLGVSRLDRALQETEVELLAWFCRRIGTQFAMRLAIADELPEDTWIWLRHNLDTSKKERACYLASQYGNAKILRKMIELGFTYDVTECLVVATDSTRQYLLSLSR